MAPRPRRRRFALDALNQNHVAARPDWSLGDLPHAKLSNHGLDLGALPPLEPVDGLFAPVLGEQSLQPRGEAVAFASCREEERIVFYLMVEAGQNLQSLEDRCDRREGTWSLDENNAPVAELSVDDIELLSVSPTLAGEMIPSTELRSHCEGAENHFGIAVTDNPATGFTRYHYFACIDGSSHLNPNHFTQLLRDSYESPKEVPSPATNAAAIRIDDRLFLIADGSCFNCTYSFAGSSARC